MLEGKKFQKFWVSSVRFCFDMIEICILLFIITLPYTYISIVNYSFYIKTESFAQIFYTIILFVLCCFMARLRKKRHIWGVVLYPIFCSYIYLELSLMKFPLQYETMSKLINALITNAWYSGTILYAAVTDLFVFSFTLAFLIYLIAFEYFKIREEGFKLRQILTVKYLMVKMITLVIVFIILFLVNIVVVASYVAC